MQATETSAKTDANDLLRVSAPARLHLGFLDLNGSYGRRYGSLGLAISHFQTTVRCRAAERLEVSGCSGMRVRQFAEQVLARLPSHPQVQLCIEEQIPAHAGLGSGTQLNLAVVAAILRAHQLPCSWSEVVALSHRGQRSGIGISCFEQGGFVIDGGKGTLEGPPPLLARVEFPSEWRILLVLDERTEGLSGGAEIAAFKTLPPMSDADSGVLCRRTLMQVMPALRELDFSTFAAGIEAIQLTLGAYFSPAQNGSFSSLAVAEVMGRVGSLGGRGIGQSSWGPTGFAFFPNATSAARVLADLEGRYGSDSGLRFVVVQGRNYGAEWTVGRVNGWKSDAKGEVAPA